ncbi:Histone-lysine N-methyltransferase, H3 lysine-36 specific [Hirsutella minnesotensis 3608]|uniref:Histone-lysine N-methyltransferase, H3 lysine-36 specific n=1 Tax=Hirsutella minnesotensis 3608 TaxID=1043627 RepID=A0A0F7ZTB7_9HYPO|nr:Histone-lysine N-methyltransferase, H3 lysine-36 specific [Hirsutella minnesotensis 3608]
MEDVAHAPRRMSRLKLEDVDANGARPDADAAAQPAAPDASNASFPSPAASPDGVKSRSDSAETPGSSKNSRSRKPSQKSATRDSPLFAHLPDMTASSCETFQVIPDCLYGSKHLGSTDNDALDCDCRDEWRDGENLACGEDSDCINRATKMECSANTGNCAGGCQNQRFQRKQWANVSVIKTEKKGFGLRTDSDLQPHDFVYEYIGEVINEPTFRRRMLQYDQEGIKHFYFMSLNKNEFVDATKKGNLGRFCNHSCSPNCYVDKWVVGDKLRMGIFALRTVRAGEELVFNYNVDRYGADPQPCYCGEPNCVGFIGGKTQTERATKLPAATVEALGIDDADGWDTAVAKKPRKKRADEDDEDYVNSIQPRGLDEDDARKVMATLMQCKEKWIAVKLLERIQRCDEERVIHCVMRMHAYQILKTTLNTFIDDHNVVLQVLKILDKMPRLTRNKIQDSNIEVTIEGLTGSNHDDVTSMSKKLLDDWSKLEVAYRIRRRKVDPNAPVQNVYEDRRGAQARGDDTAQSTPKTASPRTIDAPKGPRSSVPQRSNFFNNQRPRRQFNTPLPDGWFSAKDARGNVYFYTKTGKTTWQRPSHPASENAQKGPSKAMQEQLAIQSIIDKVTKEGTPKASAPMPKEAPEASSKETRKDKWRSLPIDKQMKIYENTVFPPVKHVLDKFRHKLPKDELKRLGKDIAKKLVASDYKNNRVGDPTAELTEKQILKIKKYVSDFLKRAVEKYQAHQKRKPAKETQAPGEPGKDAMASDEQLQSSIDAGDDGASAVPTPKGEAKLEDGVDDSILSDVETDSPGSQDRKRKRDNGLADSTDATPSEGPDLKRAREEEASPPPPPPPPPEMAPEDEMVDVQQALREQEEALMRENEEAQRLEDEAEKIKLMEDGAEELRKNIPLAV